MTNLIVLSSFSKEPFGRYESDGPFSGEIFRKTKVVPALREAINQGVKVQISIDSDNLYVDLGSSFLEEAFGGLIRLDNFSKDQLDKHLSIITDDEHDKKRIDKYVNDASNRKVLV